MHCACADLKLSLLAVSMTTNLHYQYLPQRFSGWTPRLLDCRGIDRRGVIALQGAQGLPWGSRIYIYSVGAIASRTLGTTLLYHVLLAEV